LITQGALRICSETNNGRLSTALRLVQRAIMADLPADLPALNDLQVLRFNEWCRLSGISTRTGRRLLAAGTGPATVRLSSKRMGVTVGALRQWLASRERACPTSRPGRARARRKTHVVVAERVAIGNRRMRHCAPAE